MDTIWTPAKRAITALNLGKPDEIPTFELEFQLSEEFFGYPLSDKRLEKGQIEKLSDAELERAAIDLADKYARVYGDKSAKEMGAEFCSGDEEKDSRPGLDYCIIPIYSPGWRDLDSIVTKAFRKRLREHFGNTRLFGGHGDGTFSIPSGTDMYGFAYRIADEPEAVLEDALKNISPVHLAEKMPRIPYHIFHCEADQAVNIDMHSARFVAAMREAGHEVTYDTVPEAGHCQLSPEAWAKLDAYVAASLGV